MTCNQFDPHIISGKINYKCMLFINQIIIEARNTIVEQSLHRCKIKKPNLLKTDRL